MHDPRRLLERFDRADAEENLLDFVRLTWRAIEPSRRFLESWVLGAMCEHLTAIESLKMLVQWGQLLLRYPIFRRFGRATRK